MAIIFTMTKVESRVQTMQDQIGRKGQGVSNTSYTLILSSKKNMKGSQELAARVLRNQLQVNALSIQRGFDSLDSQVLIPKALLDFLPNANKKPFSEE